MGRPRTSVTTTPEETAVKNEYTQTVEDKKIITKQRDLIIVDMLRNGMSKAAVGREFGISRVRVHHIWHKHVGGK